MEVLIFIADLAIVNVIPGTKYDQFSVSPAQVERFEKTNSVLGKIEVETEPRCREDIIPLIEKLRKRLAESGKAFYSITRCSASVPIEYIRNPLTSSSRVRKT